MKFTLVHPESGDWEALYINGKLVRETHRIDAWEVLECIKKNLVCEIESVEISDEAAEIGMPALLSDLNNTELMEG
jgi:hypothetical protein